MRMNQKELDLLLQRNKNLKIHDSSYSKNKSPQKRGKSKDEFQSYAEQKFYNTVIQPLIMVGEVLECEMHKSFIIIPAVSYGSVRFKEKKYTPDFILKMKDGTVRVIEIKGSKIRKLQRDYPLRRQLFILNFCIPQQWVFEEVSAEGITSGKE